MFKVVMFLLTVILSNYSFSQDYNSYLKIGVGYVLSTNHTLSIDDPDAGKFKQSLYTGAYDKYTYTVESGIQTQGLTLGAVYTNIIHQEKESKYIHNPERFEIFAHKQEPFIGSTMVVVGAGLMFKQDNTIKVKNENGEFTYKVINDQADWMERITARLGIVYQYKDYEISLVHHSQWLTGKPFSDKFENQKTEILISYYF
jgi:hypothetical protein